MHAHQPGRRVQSIDPRSAVRRFGGPVADELFVLCRPDAGAAGADGAAQTAYEALRDALAAERLGPEAVVSETVFVRRIPEHAAAVRPARARVLGDTGPRPAITVVGQPPLDDAADVVVTALVVAPRSGEASVASEVRGTVACACSACAPGAHARLLRLGDQTSLWAGNVHGSGATAVEEAYDAFRVAEALLADAGMGFGDVMRTWIHVRDIDRDYAALNEARRAFFQHRGVERRPASTGIQGAPPSEAHRFSLSLFAAHSSSGIDVAPMSTPSLNEASSYGADFSRGLRIADANQVTLHVSGTASVDEAGRTAHPGDFAGQVDRMLHNIATLLGREGAGFADVVSGVAYLKHASDAPRLRALLRERGFDGFPCALVEAPLCRPELLCEAEAVAVLPLARRGA